MSLKNLITEIVNIVNEEGPIKSIELITKVHSQNFDKKIFEAKEEDVVWTINEMVAAGELVEVEYVLPAMDYRVKSIYFPAGTKII